MKREEQKRLAARLAEMSREEINKLRKQASAWRKRQPRPDDESVHPVSVDEVMLRLLEQETTVRRVLETRNGTVVWSGRKTCRVRGPEHATEASLDGHHPAVGDEVAIGLAPDRKTWLLTGIEHRRTKLSRPDVGNANVERVVVANVDRIGVVVSVGSPPLHPRIIDRYLIAIERGGAEPLLCVNKIDLLADPAELELLDPYRELGVPIVLCSASTGQGIDELRAEVEGRACAFVGHSGVGKSSLVNALYPGLELATGELSTGYGRGTHTTVASNLFEFEGGTRLIDTPGIRSFGLGKLSLEELRWHFPEFDPWECRFRDCSHSHEPKCGVREAAERGDIHPARYDTYRRLLEGEVT